VSRKVSQIPGGRPSKTKLLPCGEVDNFKYIDGMIDDVAIFGRALSAEEISELANTNLASVTSVEAKAKLATIWARLKDQ
jgi:hypothetical protein